MILSETRLEKNRWKRIKERLPRRYRWEKQMARSRNKKGRVMGGILMRVKKKIEVIEMGNGEVIEGLLVEEVRIAEETWRVVGK